MKLKMMLTNKLPIERVLLWTSDNTWIGANESIIVNEVYPISCKSEADVKQFQFELEDGILDAVLITDLKVLREEPNLTVNIKEEVKPIVKPEIKIEETKETPQDDIKKTLQLLDNGRFAEVDMEKLKPKPVFLHKEYQKDYEENNPKLVDQAIFADKPVQNDINKDDVLLQHGNNLEVEAPKKRGRKKKEA